MRIINKKAADIILRVLLYISRFLSTVTLLCGNPALEHPGLLSVSRVEYYMFGGTYWQNTWTSFWGLACLLLVDSWLFYFLSAKHREKVVKPFFITDLVCIYFTIIFWNYLDFGAHTWLLFFFWLLLHCLKRFLDYYAYIRRDPEKNSLRSLLPKAPERVYIALYVLVIILFVCNIFTVWMSNSWLSIAGSFAIAVAMVFALTVYLSKKKAENQEEDLEEQGDGSPVSSE